MPSRRTSSLAARARHVRPGRGPAGPRRLLELERAEGEGERCVVGVGEADLEHERARAVGGRGGRGRIRPSDRAAQPVQVAGSRRVRAVPNVAPAASAQAPSWASSRRTTDAGYIATDVGCADSTSAADLDEFFRARMGPVLGHDYQHVYPLGGDRYLWLFQDTFVDQPGVADELDEAAFAHNTALVQTGRCFTLYHRGSSTSPTSFEPGTGEQALSRWFWPLGGELAGDRLSVFWAEMTKDPDPGPGDGLGWHPAQTWLATYDAATLERLDFAPAPNSGTTPIYGYAVASDGRHTYLFGNTFDQNLARQGGWRSGPHSATRMWLARVPRGRLGVEPEYRTGADGAPIRRRPGRSRPASGRRTRCSRGSSATSGSPRRSRTGSGAMSSSSTSRPSRGGRGPRSRGCAPTPRAGDPLMNTYHAYLMPWLEDGSLVVSLSQNARDMLEDAFPHPERYRLQFLRSPLVPPPAHAAADDDDDDDDPDHQAAATTRARRPRRRRRRRRRPASTTTTTTTTTATTTTTPSRPRRRPRPIRARPRQPRQRSSTTTTTTTPASTTTDPCDDRSRPTAVRSGTVGSDHAPIRGPQRSASSERPDGSRARSRKRSGPTPSPASPRASRCSPTSSGTSRRSCRSWRTPCSPATT